MPTESFLIWAAAFGLSLLIVGPYLWRFRRRVHLDKERKAEAIRLGIDQPSAQYPYIDPAHCIGCGACVAACPEGDVLGVVGGTAVVINGLRCVGHARCEVACPVGAITVGLGDLASRADVPQLSDGHESSVPGIYVVGELGGLALVRNAVAQGREAAQAIAARSETTGRMEQEDGWDLVIVGAGPAGLSAGLTAHAAGLRCLVLEREETLGGSLLHYPRRKMVLTQPVDLPPWGQLEREEYSKESLLEILENMVADVGLDVRFGTPVTAIDGREGAFEVQAGDRILPARSVILALGRRGSPRKLGVPGEDLPKVMYRLLDAASYVDRDILVVGGGDSAAEAAIGLSCQPRNRVTLSYRREKIVRVKRKNQEALDRAIETGAIKPLFSSQVSAIDVDRVSLEVEGRGMVELDNDDVFVFAGGVPPFGLLKKLGVRFGGESSPAYRPGSG